MRNLTTVLVAVDLSQFCISALSEAGRLAQRDGAILHVVHVVSNDFVEGHRQLFVAPVSSVIADITEQVQTYAQRHLGEGVRFEVHVKVGRPADEIIATSAVISADLIVLGAHGKSRRSTNDIGIVAARCVRRAPIPVMLVRSAQSGAFRTVVAAIDYSEASRHALEEAAIVADRDGAVLHLLHVHRIPWQWFTYSDLAPASPEKAEQDKYRAESKERMEGFAGPIRQAFPKLKIVAVVLDRQTGVDAEIRMYVEQVRADLVVIGARGSSDLKEILLGTTAERFIHRSHCSVLTVRSSE